MKKIIILFAILLFFTDTMAQDKNIRLPEKPKQGTYVDYEMQDKGFWCGVETDGGSSIMLSHTNMQYVNLLFMGGYRINEFIRVGIGFGPRFYVNNGDIRNSEHNVSIPIFATARGNFLSAYDRDAVPYWSMHIGGAVRDGFYMSPTLGYSFGGLRNCFLIGICYTLSTFEDLCKDNRRYSYFGLRLGYEF